MYSYRSPAAKDLAPDTHGSISRRRMSSRLLARAPLVVGVALAIAGGFAQAEDEVEEESASVVFKSDLIGLNIRPAVPSNGGPNQINHVPGLDGGTSQAVLIDFGKDVHVNEATLGGLFRESGCSEVGRWTAFNAAGTQLEPGTGTFVAENSGAGDKEVVFPQKSLRYLAFSAEPYQDCTEDPADIDDSSDYLIKRISFMFDGEEEEKLIPNAYTESFVDPLEQSNFLAYDPDEPFTDDDGNLIDPEGDRLFGTIIIDEGKCDGGIGDGSEERCDIELVDKRFTSTFEKAPDIDGTLTVRRIKTIDDDRDVCLTPDNYGDAGKLYLDNNLKAWKEEDWNEENNSEPAIIIPSYLCGIPVDVDGSDTAVPKFTVIELESTLTVLKSVITHTVLKPNDDFEFDCRSDKRRKQPVIGWLPRDGEFPVIGPDDMESRTMEDVTTGCGSTRGTTFRMSYLLFDLRHLPGTDYSSVVDGEFKQLRATLLQFAACVNNGTLTSTVESSVDKAARWFDRGRRDKATGELIKLRSEVEDFNSRLGRDLPSCFWNNADGWVIDADPTAGLNESGLTPRNARGDLLTQIDHILYMIESKFGDVQAPDDASEAPQSQGKAKSNGKNKKQ